MKRPFLPFVLPWLLAATDASAGVVVCHTDYGGEQSRIVAAPAASPYEVRAEAIGSKFRFRVVFQPEPRDLASIKVYVYAAEPDGATLIHQATYPYPLPDGGGRYGFTGLLAAYEPVLGAELQYWCELRP